MPIDLLPALEQAPRLMLYAHDTYGLGHLRRNLAIAGHLVQAIPGLSVLLVTGSPVAQNFDLPPGADYIKLPSVVKTGNDQYRARTLEVSPERIRQLRAAIIADVSAHFAPDVVLVDHAPLGMNGELLQALRHLRQYAPATRIVLGLRDILDEPQRVREQWTAQGVYTAIEEFYDRLLIYGQADIFDPVSAYALPPALAARTHFCGYIRREEPVRPAGELRAELELDDAPFILITTGGGGDGAALESAFLDALPRISHNRAVQAVVVTGPLMAEDECARLEARCAAYPTVRLRRFHPDMPGLMRASALVVAMGGYNTLCEILVSGRPAVIVPRSQPRLEQYLRTQAFAARGFVEMLSVAEATPARLAAAIERGLEQGAAEPAARIHWDANGLPRIAAHIARLLPAGSAARRRVSA